MAVVLSLLAVANCGHRSAQPRIQTPPAELGLDPFYAKYMDVNGIILLSSARCSDEAMLAAYRTIYAMTCMLPPEVTAEMARNGAKMVVMAKDEVTTDVPEHAYLKADTVTNWDVRARGLGGDLYDPTSSCAEENVLCLDGDRYWREDILVHEFSHAIHQLGIAPSDPTFDERLKSAYEKAMAEGKWADTYASVNMYEYWAEGVQSWFNVNTEVENPDGVHGRVNTRDELRRYDADLHALLACYFPDTQEKVSNHSTDNKYDIDAE